MNKKQLVRKLIRNASESSEWFIRQFGKQIIINGRYLVTDGCNAIISNESYSDFDSEAAVCCSLKQKEVINRIYQMAFEPGYYIPCKKFDLGKLNAFEKEHRYTTSPRRKATQSGYLRFGATTGYPIKMILAMLEIMPDAVISYGGAREPLHFWDAKRQMVGLIMPAQIDYTIVRKDSDGNVVDVDFFAPSYWNFEEEE